MPHTSLLARKARSAGCQADDYDVADWVSKSFAMIGERVKKWQNFE